MKKIFKKNRNKKNRGDIAVFALITFGALIVSFYGIHTVSSNLSSVRNNASLALDSSLFYLSTLGETSVIIKETGTEIGNDYQTICTMDENELIVKTLNYVCPLLIEKQNGFNRDWTVWMSFRNNSNYNKSPNYYKFFTSGSQNNHSSYDGTKWNYFWMVSADSQSKNEKLQQMDGIKLSRIPNQPRCPTQAAFNTQTNAMLAYEKANKIDPAHVKDELLFDTVCLFIDVKVPTYNISDYNHYFNTANPNWTWSPNAIGAERGHMQIYGTSQCRGGEKKTIGG